MGSVRSVRSVVDEFAAEDVRSLSDDELAEHVVELERAVRALEAHRARAIAEVDARRSYAADGFLSTTAWLAARTGVAASVAAHQVRLARSLPSMPATRTALEQGEISFWAAVVLSLTREDDPEAFERCEPALVDAARTLRPRELRLAIDRWRQLVDAEHGEQAERRRFERRALYVSSTLDGMVRLDGDLDPETGQVVLTALRSILDADARGADADDRRPAQRRADALGEICRTYLDSADRPTVAGERPHLSLSIDAGALRSGRGAGELENAGAVAAGSVRRIACDATVSRVVLNARSEPLDLGRRTAVVPPALRRAVAIRDRGCRFPGCDRPESWCDAHHAVHWADGGETSVSNLVLLCRRHHRAVHERFSMRMLDGRPVFARPDGTALEDRAPP